MHKSESAFLWLPVFALFFGTSQHLASAPLEVGPHTGEINGAPYRIDMPPQWNGNLVMIAHGYEPVGVPRAESWPQAPASPMFLAQGYAVAESGYRSQGWAVAEALEDIEALRQHFSSQHEPPKSTYLYGVSLGSHIALATLERHPEHYAGALSTCGVNGPAENMISEGVVTALVALDYFFPTALPAGGLTDANAPSLVDPEQIEAALASDETRTAILVQRLEIDRPALAGAMMLNWMVLRELQQRAGGHPVDNRDVVYAGFGDDDAFNRGVRRYAADAKAAEYLRTNASLSGRIEDPVVLLSNDRDPTIPPRFAKIYPALVKAADRAELLTVMPNRGVGHCDFTPDDIEAGWAQLVQSK